MHGRSADPITGGGVSLAAIKQEETPTPPPSLAPSSFDHDSSADAFTSGADTALFSTFVDFGDLEEPGVPLFAPSSGHASLVMVPSPSHSGSLSDAEPDPSTFLSPPHSSCSPRSNPQLEAGGIIGSMLPPSPAEPSLATFTPGNSADSNIKLEQGLSSMVGTLAGPSSWVGLIPTVSTPTPPPPADTSDGLIKLLRSDTANACSKLLTEPVKRKPGRKKKCEVVQPPAPTQPVPLLIKPLQPAASAILPLAPACPPPVVVKGESESDGSTGATGKSRLPTAPMAQVANSVKPVQPAPAVGGLSLLSKKQERMVKNREAADQSRKRKREHLASLETHAQALIIENDGLRARLLELEALNLKLMQENAALRAATGAMDPSFAMDVVMPVFSGSASASPLPAPQSLDRDCLEAGIKKPKNDVFVGASEVTSLPAKPLGAMFMMVFFSLFLFMFPNRLPSPSLTSRHPQSLSSWASKKADLISLDDRSMATIDASPAPLLLPGSRKSTALIELPGSTTSFLLTSPVKASEEMAKSVVDGEPSTAVQTAIDIPLVNLTEVLSVLTSATSGLSQEAKSRIVMLQELLKDGKELDTLAQETVAAVTEAANRRAAFESKGPIKRVGPRLVPVQKDLIPLPEAKVGLPLEVKNYLASLRGSSDLALPTGDAVKPLAWDASDTIAARLTAPKLYPSRFCPNRAGGTGLLLSLMADLSMDKPAARGQEDTAEEGNKDAYLDPLLWKASDLKKELQQWSSGDRKSLPSLFRQINVGENVDDTGKNTRMKNSYLQLDVEVATGLPSSPPRYVEPHARRYQDTFFSNLFLTAFTLLAVTGFTTLMRADHTNEGKSLSGAIYMTLHNSTGLLVGTTAASIGAGTLWILFMSAFVKLACQILWENPTVFILSIGIMITYMIFALVWLLAFAHLFLVHPIYPIPMSTRTALIFFVLMHFWTSAVLQGIEKMTIAGVVGKWYFKRNEDETHEEDQTYKNFKAAITTGFGTICFSSLILAVVQTIQAIIKYVRKVRGV
ncbi:hypothetical protein HDU96_009703 [Phlyctochytrium bullatum]|nr:hypothetical protein HDU96_009703 [Phlyctochytrium bullatum]